MKAIASYHDLVRRDALEFLPQSVGRVLDFGGGIGATAAALRDSGRAEHVVLFDQVADNALPQIDAAESLNFEDIGAVTAAAAAHGPFDTILALDVLEHLRDPWAVAEALSGALKPGGMLLVSVPNVSCYELVAPLVFRNRFDYTPSGTMDRTHLRWFTRDTAIALTCRAGLTFEKLGTRPMTKRHKLLNLVTFGLLYRFLVFQWLVIARKTA